MTVESGSEPTPLTRDHTTGSFTCGDADLDAWLKTTALHNQEHGFSRTFVLTKDGGPEIVGFYCLSACQVVRRDAPEQAGADSPGNLPAVLMGRMGVLATEHRRGIGTAMVTDAMARAVRISKQIGIRLLVVDAKTEELVDYYGRFGFQLIRGRRSGHRMAVTIPDLEATFEAAGETAQST